MKIYTDHAGVGHGTFSTGYLFHVTTTACQFPPPLSRRVGGWIYVNETNNRHA